MRSRPQFGIDIRKQKLVVDEPIKALRILSGEGQAGV